MKGAGNGTGVKNISGLVLKKCMAFVKQKALQKNKFMKKKITERKIYERFGNLSEDELNTKSNKNVYVRNDVVT